MIFWMIVNVNAKLDTVGIYVGLLSNVQLVLKEMIAYMEVPLKEQQEIALVLVNLIMMEIFVSF